LPIGDSFFASVGFAELWRLAGGEPRYRLLHLDGELAAVLPAVEFGRGRMARLQSMPDGCYGSLHVCEAARPERGRLASVLIDHLKQSGLWRFHLVDFAHQFDHVSELSSTPCTTQLVDIRDPEWWPADAKIRSQIRSAERQGVDFVPFDWARHGAGYLRIAQHTAARQDRDVVYPVEIYEALSDLSKRDARLHWIWFEWEGEPACSHMYVREGEMLLGWQIQFDKRFSRQKPNQYMRWRTCREFAARGCTHLNLGATPDGAKSLTYYKRRWGGETVRYQTWVHQSLWSKVLRR
jgi:Acetyltransferase (GNAT) domain